MINKNIIFIVKIFIVSIFISLNSAAISEEKDTGLRDLGAVCRSSISVAVIAKDLRNSGYSEEQAIDEIISRELYKGLETEISENEAKDSISFIYNNIHYSKLYEMRDLTLSNYMVYLYCNKFRR